jgi:hypothetical protein
MPAGIRTPSLRGNQKNSGNILPYSFPVRQGFRSLGGEGRFDGVTPVRMTPVLRILDNQGDFMMHSKRNLRTRLCLNALLMSAVTSLAQTPLGNGFTYQGRLNAGGAPLNGTADFAFRLWDAETGGQEVASTVSISRVNVVEGLFIVELDFGPNVFYGNARWLEIDVANPTGGQFVTLTPRQALTATPYSLQTRGIVVNEGGTVSLPTDGNNLEVGTATPSGWTDANGIIGFPGYGASHGQIAYYPEPGAGSFGFIDSSDSTPSGDYGLLTLSQNLAEIWAGNAVFNGNVGIGIESPVAGARLQVTGGESRFEGIAFPGGFGADTAYVGTDGNYISFGHEGVSEDFIGYANNTFYFKDALGGADGTQPNVIMSGNVGIGTDSPTQKLDVAGWIKTHAVQITGGSDIAEPYDVAASSGVSPVAGMVVSIDSERLGKMRLSSSAYDRTVAGIISGANGVNPGLTLTQEGSVADGAMPVANVGRVWCFCDATAGGPIVAGDLLTTSNTTGHAMKVTDHSRSQGAIIGKAMSNLESGRGLVLVLVSLQ